MSVAKQNESYEYWLPMWEKMRDVSAGQEVIHGAGEKYLPKLSGQDSKAYRAYRDRALFYNATKRTVDGLSGMIFRRPPDITMPSAMEDMLEDVTLDGLPHQAFSENCVEEVLEAGRAGVLVDFPHAENQIMTVAQAEQSGLRPFWKLYKAENIIDWRVGQVGNITKLVQVRLNEFVTEQVDEFDSEEVHQIRVLDLYAGEEGTSPARYRVRIFRQVDGIKDWIQVGNDIFPLMRGRPMSYIPFVFMSTRDTLPAIKPPPLLDLANVNLSHYKTTADLMHGAHFTGLPTPVVSGYQLEDGEVLKIGSEEAWVLPDSQASATYLEFTGTGLSALESVLNRLEEQMAALGAKMLAPEKRAAEAAETTRIKHQGESSVLASLAMAVSGALTDVMTITRDWMGLSGDVAYDLNHDFDPVALGPDELKELVKAWQAGAISMNTLFENLKRGEVIRTDKALDEEKAEIEDEGGGLAPVPVDADSE